MKRIPKKLYKYKSLSGDSFEFSKSIIVDNKIYFSKNNELNDPFEGLFRIEIPRLLLATTIPVETAIFSLSSKKDEMLMWSHYADSHKGICLEFDTRISDSPFAIAQPVNYLNTYDKYTFDADFDAAQVSESVSLTKSRHWKYEKEWRVIGSAGGLCEFPPESLTGVIAGCKICLEDYEWLQNLIKQRTTPLKLYKSIPDKYPFSLKIIEVSSSFPSDK